MGKASRDQLETMASLGVFEGEDVTMDQAAGLIEQATSLGFETDHSKMESAAPRIAEILMHRAALAVKMKRHAVQKLKTAKDNDYMPSILSNLEQDLARWSDELKQFKESSKKNRDDYLKFWQARLTDDPGFEQLGYPAHLKEPSLEQLDKVLSKLDANNPDWENSSNTGDFVNEEEYVFQALIKKYPKLRQENGKSSHLSEVFGKLSGELSYNIDEAHIVGLAAPAAAKLHGQRNGPSVTRTIRRTPIVIACCVFIIIIYAFINIGDKIDEVKPASAEELGLLNPRSSIELERLVWTNADETETMEVRFKLTNKTKYPVTDIEVKFDFYELEGAKLDEDKIITFEDVIQPYESQQYVKYSLGSYPQETIRVSGRVLSVSKLQDR